MFITDDGIQLHIEIERPEQTGPLPMVILSHGFTGHMEEPHILGIRDTILSSGYAVLRCELYGHGQSGGEFRSHNLFKWLNNLMTIIDYAVNLPDVSDLYLAGHSQGGLAVMLAAAMKQDVIKGLIPLSPAVMIPEDAREGNLLGIPFDPLHVPGEFEIEGEGPLSGNYTRAAQTIYAERIYPCYKGPVLMIHADADETVPYEVAETAAGNYENCRLVKIPGDTHCYDCHLDLVQQAIGEWLKEQRGE